MTAETPLDAAHRAMEAAPGDDAARLRFHERVMDAELFVLLEEEAEDDRIRPRVFEVEDGPLVLAFDRDDRLAAFLDAPAPYAALAGRRLAALLAGRGIGIVLNAGASSEAMLTAAAIDWLAADGASATPDAALPREVAPPNAAAPELVAALAAKLAAMTGMLGPAWLATLRLADGTERLALAVADAPEAARPAIAEAIAEALRFSGLDGAGLDVTFLEADAPARAAFDRVGLRFDPPPPPAPPDPPRAPGSDPDRPPRLR